MMDLLKQVKYIYDTRPIVAATLVFFVAFVVIGGFYIYDTGDTVVDDHFFHYKFAKLIKDNGWSAIKDFDWIYMNGISSDEARYSVGLYNIAIISFTYFKDAMLGLKVMDTFFASMFFAIIYYSLRKMRVKYPLFFVLFLASTSYILTRVLSGRAFVLAVAFIFLEIYLAVDKKYKPLFFLTMLHVLWHQSTFFMPLAVVGVVELSRYLYVHRMFWKNIVSVVIGIAIAMIVYPGYPMNMFGIVKNIINVTGIGGSKEEATSIGIEAIQKDFFSSFVNGFELFSLVSIFGIVIAIFYYINNRQNIPTDQSKPDDTQKLMVLLYAYFLFLISVILGATVITGRFFDYYLPTAAIIFGITITVLIKDKQFTFKNLSLQKILFRTLYGFVIVLCIGALIVTKQKFVKFDQAKLRNTAEWIEKRAEEGDKVYLDNWSYFTPLFFYNDKVKYSMGLEPHDAMVYKPELYWKWHNFRKNAYYCEKQESCREQAKQVFDAANKLPEEKRMSIFKDNSKKVIESIGKDFGARFIVSDNKNFNNLLHNNKELFVKSLKVTDKKGKVVMEVFELKKELINE